MPERHGVTFGEKHSYSDWGVYWNGYSNPFPSPFQSLIEIPYNNRVLNATKSLTDKVIYKSRTLTLTFLVGDNIRSWHELRSEIADYLHGQEIHVILDTDPDYYWDAYSCSVSDLTNNDDGIGQFTITCTCFPYKLKNILTEKQITVSSSNMKMVCENSRMEVNPTFNASQPVQVVWTDRHGDQFTIAMAAGTHTYSNVEFVKGENILTFNKLTNNSNVTVSYREGEL